MGNDTVYFYDQVRSGLGGIGIFSATDPTLRLQSTLVSGDREPWKIDVGTDERKLQVAGPAEVLKLNPEAVAATQPPDQFQEFPYNLFASVDFADEDLPWRLSPSPGRGTARPWLVLVVVPHGPEIDLVAESEDRPAALHIRGTARTLLPDLEHSHLWAHAQQQGTRARARLICPVTLQPGTRYVAAVVPAFREGRDAGLGRAPQSRSFTAAWTVAERDGEGGMIELPALYSWRFRTSELADFSELAEKLRRLADARRDGLGLRPIRVAPCPHARPPEPPAPWEQVPGGALVGTAVSRPLAGTEEQRAWFREALAPIGAPANTPVGVLGYDALRDDPVAGPVDYGAELRGPQGEVWARELNETPAWRAMAGIGAEAVRRHQEELTVALLDRAGELRTARSEHHRVLVAATVALGRVGRVVAMPDASFVPAARFVAGTLGLAEGPETALPRGVLSAPLQRQLRSATPAGRAIRRGAVAPAPAKQVARREVIPAPTVEEPRELDRMKQVARREIAPAARMLAAFVATDGPDLRRLRALDPHVAPTTARIAVDTATRARQKARPLQALCAQLGVGSIVGAPAQWGTFAQFGAGLTLRLPSQVSLEFPVSAWIREIDPDLLVPGIGAFDEHGVTLLEVNRATVEAMLVGGNDALAREVAWRDLPVPRGTTLLPRFWEGTAENRPDTGPIRGWKSSLGGNLAGQGSLVLVLRSPLLRLYPGLEVAMVKCDEGKPLHGSRTLPLFRGLLDAGTLYAGFSLTATAARGTGTRDGWFVELRQPAGATVFGTDVEPSGARTVGGDALPEVLAGAGGSSRLAARLLRAPGRAFIHASWLL